MQRMQNGKVAVATTYVNDTPIGWSSAIIPVIYEIAKQHPECESVQVGRNCLRLCQIYPSINTVGSSITLPC